MMRKVFAAALVLFLAAGATAFAQELRYRSHLADVGWTTYVSSGRMSGTTGQGRRMEAIQLQLTGAPAGSNIEINAHVQDVGWQGWRPSGQVAGTTGQARRIEAIQVRLTGPIAQNFAVTYRVHMAGTGWGPWVTNGATAGTTGQARQIEAIQVLLHEN